jgi:hypothetical protein
MRITDLTLNANEVKITNPAGTDVSFRNSSSRMGEIETGKADAPGSHMMSGQMIWEIELETINGKIVYDGSINPPPKIVSNQTDTTYTLGLLEYNTTYYWSHYEKPELRKCRTANKDSWTQAPRWVYRCSAYRDSNKVY